MLVPREWHPGEGVTTVNWLKTFGGLRLPSTGGLGSVPAPGTKVLHATQHGQRTQHRSLKRQKIFWLLEHKKWPVRIKLQIFEVWVAEHLWASVGWALFGSLRHLFMVLQKHLLLSRWALGCLNSRCWALVPSVFLIWCWGEGKRGVPFRENNRENLAFACASKFPHHLFMLTGNFWALTPWHTYGWAPESWYGGDPGPASAAPG